MLEDLLKRSWANLRRNTALVVGSALLAGALGCSDDKGVNSDPLRDAPYWQSQPPAKTIPEDSPDGTMICENFKSYVKNNGGDPLQFSVGRIPH
jgi:hypothetical protein